MEIPENVLVWKFGGKSGNLKSDNNYLNNQGYNLLCKKKQSVPYMGHWPTKH